MKGKEVKRKRNWKTVALLAVVGILLFSLFLPAILKWVNSWECLKNCAFFGVTSDISDWFAFWGSLLGVIVSIVLTAITLQITNDIEENNNNRIKLQNISTLIMQTPYMYCGEMRMYSQKHNDIFKDLIFPDSLKQDYMLNIEMSIAFPAYFDVVVDKVKIVLPADYGEGISSYVHIPHYKILSNERFCLYMDMPNDKSSSLERLYTMEFWAPSDSPATKKSSCDIVIDLSLNNKLYLDNDNVENESIKLQFDMTVQNKGEQIEQHNNKVIHKYKMLEVINMTMKRIE